MGWQTPELAYDPDDESGHFRELASWHTYGCEFCDITVNVPDGQPRPTCNGETGGQSRSGGQPSGRWHRPVPMLRRGPDR